MKTTRYFEEQVRRKRPYLRREWIEAIIAAPARREFQEDGRARLWGPVTFDGVERWLRVVLLDDGETVHNAFFDRGYREDQE